ncbi:MAG: hypothetical protein ACXVR9_12585 [Gaiellaceae bacterium]
MMVGLVLPNFRVFLHVFGAMTLVGGVGAVAVLAFATRRRPDHAALLSRLAFRTLLFVVVPAFIVMRVGAQLVVDKEYPDKTPGWVDVGFIVTEPGLIVLIAIGVIAFMSSRRGGSGGLATALAVLAPIYLLALGVAMWAMTARPG